MMRWRSSILEETILYNTARRIEGLALSWPKCTEALGRSFGMPSYGMNITDSDLLRWLNILRRSASCSEGIQVIEVKESRLKLPFLGLTPLPTMAKVEWLA